ncbi:Regulator of chromosome condensation [Trichinella patagoniensis]|uniref:Regulator of chromosome condensation n=1 Tax=Trichinella patagoniensis TaxID=990121 RepID=A0A0V0ZI18_9BILA|nr:Regulator of chromosome condensation [Trichinella patagoniensis]
MFGDPDFSEPQQNDPSKGACRKCGYVGHLTYQCRNLIKLKAQKDVVIDISSTSSESETDTPIVAEEKKKLSKLMKKKERKERKEKRKEQAGNSGKGEKKSKKESKSRHDGKRYKEHKKKKTEKVTSKRTEKVSQQGSSGKRTLNVAQENHRNEQTVAKKRKPAEQFLPEADASDLFVCGVGDMGQLGLGDDVRECHKFRRVKFNDSSVKIKMVAAGGCHSLVLSCGCNDEGALGRAVFENDEEVDEDCTFAKVQFDQEDLNEHGEIAMISAGDSHGAALTVNGSVFIWGRFRGKNGALGLMVDQKTNKVISQSKTPVLLLSYKNHKIVKISSGCNHLMCLDESGKVWTIGDGSDGQLGRIFRFDFDLESIRVTRRLLSLDCVELKHKCKNVFAVAQGSFAITIDDNVIVWGLNGYAQLGFPIEGKGSLQVVKIPTPSPGFESNGPYACFSGEHHILSANRQGELYSIGRVCDGRLGIENLQAENDIQSTLLRVESLSKFVLGVTAAGSCSFCWTREGKAYSWGANIGGMLGLPVEEDLSITTPTEIPVPQDFSVVQLAASSSICMMLSNHKLKISVTLLLFLSLKLNFIYYLFISFHTVRLFFPKMEADLVKEFEEVAEQVRRLKSRPTDNELLELYALYKQSTVGDASEEKPGVFDFKGKSKWDVWRKRKGMSKTDAMKEYIKMTKQIINKYGTDL